MQTGWLQGLQDVSGPSQADDNGQVALCEAVSSEVDCGGLRTIHAGDSTPGLKVDAWPGKKS